MQRRGTYGLSFFTLLVLFFANRCSLLSHDRVCSSRKSGSHGRGSRPERRGHDYLNRELSQQKVRGAAVSRVVLEAAVGGRVVGGRDDDAVGEVASRPRLYDQDRLGDGGGRGEAVAAW